MSKRRQWTPVGYASQTRARELRGGGGGSDGGREKRFADATGLLNYEAHIFRPTQQRMTWGTCLAKDY